MAFFRFLQGMGDRLGILESVSKTESLTVTRIQTRSVSLNELASEIRSGEVRALANSLDELGAPFEKIFATAGLSLKPDDWTMDRLKQVIQERMRSEASRESIQKAVLDLLNAEGVSSEILIKDAMARDQALDAFEAGLNERIRARDQVFTLRLQEIETQMRNLQDESRRISENLKADTERWQAWKKGKRAYERELASNIAYLVNHSVVTADEEN